MLCGIELQKITHFKSNTHVRVCPRAGLQGNIYDAFIHKGYTPTISLSQEIPKINFAHKSRIKYTWSISSAALGSLHSQGQAGAYMGEIKTRSALSHPLSTPTAFDKAKAVCWTLENKITHVWWYGCCSVCLVHMVLPADNMYCDVTILILQLRD